jgi:hypothetical protein
MGVVGDRNHVDLAIDAVRLPDFSCKQEARVVGVGSVRQSTTSTITE